MPFAEAVQQTVDGETDRLGLFGGTREIVFYLNVRGPIREFHTLSDLENAADPPRWIIVRRRDWEKQHLSGNVVVAETLFPWEDAATAAGKLLLVEIHSR